VEAAIKATTHKTDNRDSTVGITIEIKETNLNHKADHHKRRRPTNKNHKKSKTLNVIKNSIIPNRNLNQPSHKSIKNHNQYPPNKKMMKCHKNHISQVPNPINLNIHNKTQMMSNNKKMNKTNQNHNKMKQIHR
jgi:hypothetical protein